MYVYTDGLDREAHEDYDNTIHWCLRTLKDFGPDDALVGRQDCEQPLTPLLRAGLTEPRSCGIQPVR